MSQKRASTTRRARRVARRYASSRRWRPGEGSPIALASRSSAAALTGRRDPAAAAARLAARVGTTVVKCGADGVVVWAAGTDRPLTVTAEVAEVADVTGAGDAFAAGYLVALADGAEPAEAARAGNLLAARAVATVGAWPAPPTP